MTKGVNTLGILKGFWTELPGKVNKTVISRQSKIALQGTRICSKGDPGNS